MKPSAETKSAMCSKNKALQQGNEKKDPSEKLKKKAKIKVGKPHPHAHAAPVGQTVRWEM